MAGSETTESPGGPPHDLSYYDYFTAIGKDILTVWSTIWRRRLILFVAVFISLVIGLCIALFSQPVYRAETLIVVRTSNSSANGLGRLLSGSSGVASSLVGGLNNDRPTQELIAALQARKLMYPFIEKFDLKRALFPNLWDAENGQWRVRLPNLASRVNNSITGAPLPPTSVGPTMTEVQRELLKHMSIVDDVKSGIIRLSIEWKDPAQAATWVNGLVMMLNDMNREEAIVDSQARIKSLQAQLATTTSVDMKQVNINLIQSETEQIVAAQSERQFSLRVLDPAVPPEEHVWPRRSLIMILSLLIGFLAGSILALLLPVLSELLFGSRRARPGILANAGDALG